MKRSSYIFSIHKNVGLLPYARKHAKILLIPRLLKGAHVNLPLPILKKKTILDEEADG